MDKLERVVREIESDPNVLNTNCGLTLVSVSLLREVLTLLKEQDEWEKNVFNEWCDDCKEYEKEQMCCHRFTKVIRQTVDELKKQKWISVTDRLPETRRFVPYGPISSSKVLFKTSDKTMHLGYLIKDSYVDEYAGETILHRWYDDHGDRIENVTKWCEPPKEEDDER